MYEIFWEMYQLRRIDEVDRTANRAASGVQTTERRVRELEARVDALTLSCMTMWSFIQSQLGVTDEQFAAKLREIDLMDGKVDGRLIPEVKACEACGRTMSTRHTRCMYCGGESLRKRPFEGAR